MNVETTTVLDQTPSSEPAPPTPSISEPTPPQPGPPQPGAAPETPPVEPPVVDPPASSDAWLSLVSEGKRGANVFQGVNATTPGEAIEQLGEQLVNAQSKIGDVGVKVPGPDSTAEEIGAFRKHHSIPDQPSGYQLPTDGLYEGKALSESGTAYLRKVAEGSRERIQNIAHDMNLTPTQTAKLYRHFTSTTGEDISAHEVLIGQTKEAQKKELQQQWGGAYQQEMGLGDAAMRQFGGDEMIALAEQVGIKDHPTFRKMMAGVGKTIANHDIFGSGGNAQLMDNREEAAAKIKTLKADPEYLKKTVKGRAIVKEVTALYKVAFPNEDAPA